MSDLDSILSGGGGATPNPEPVHQETTPEPAAPAEPEGEPSGEPSGQKTVPLAALQEERSKSKRYTEALSDVERKLSEQNQAWERRFNQMLEAVKPQQQPQPAPDFFADPDAAMNHRLEPLQQRFEKTISGLALRASRAEALAEYGKEAVADLERAIGEAIAANDPEVFKLRQDMLASDHPVGVAMEWHNRRRVLSEVGTDPAAYREKLKAEILAELQQTQQPATAAPVMPSNLAGARNVGVRSGPAWSGPKPLADIFKR